MVKIKSGLHWYQYVHNFLSLHKSYIVMTKNESQRLSLIGIINSNKDKGIRLKVEFKKYGLYVCRGKHGGDAIVTEDVAKHFCEANNIEINSDCIIPYTAKQFELSHRLKNVNVHRCKRIPKYVPYDEQLNTTEWKKFRKLVFESRGRKCEICGTTAHLQVHHPEYKSGRKAWEYSLNDVIVLCRNCHKAVHGIV